MLAAALSVRGHSVRGQRGWVAPGRIRGMGARSGTPAPGGDDTWRVIRPPSGQVPGSKLMALIVTTDRVIAPATLHFPPSAGLTDLAAPSFADLTASDDTGTSYQINFTEGGWAGSTWTGTIVFRPPPSPAARLLTVSGPNGPVLRAQLGPDPAAGQLAATATPLPDSPGERLLIRRAEALLGALASPGRPALRRAAGNAAPRPELPGNRSPKSRHASRWPVANRRLLERRARSRAGPGRGYRRPRGGPDPLPAQSGPGHAGGTFPGTRPGRPVSPGTRPGRPVSPGTRPGRHRLRIQLGREATGPLAGSAGLLRPPQPAAARFRHRIHRRDAT
jgi:hypothetical protein